MHSGSIPPEAIKPGDSAEQEAAKRNAWTKYHAREQGNVGALADALAAHCTLQGDLGSIVEEQKALDDTWHRCMLDETGGDQRHARYQVLLTWVINARDDLDRRAWTWLRQRYPAIVEDACDQLGLQPSWFDDLIWRTIQQQWDTAVFLLKSDVINEYWRREQPYSAEFIRSEADLMAHVRLLRSGGHFHIPGLLFPWPPQGMTREEYKMMVCATVDAIWPEVAQAPIRRDRYPGQRKGGKPRGARRGVTGQETYSYRVRVFNLWWEHPTKWQERPDLWQDRHTITWADLWKKYEERFPELTHTEENKFEQDALQDTFEDMVIAALRWAAPACGVARTFEEFILSDPPFYVKAPDGGGEIPKRQV